ncbi:hypothetical protein [Photorhabdus sp. MH8.4]
MALLLILTGIYTLWISRWIATARKRIPGSIDNYVTGVSECSQQRGNLKDNGYNMTIGKVIWYWQRKPDIQYPETPPYLRCFRNKATY